MTASPRYLQLLTDMADLHKRKSAGYSGADNPDTWANFRNAKGWGVTELQGCLVRMADKYTRAQNIFRQASNEQVGEGLTETLIDLAAYALIAVCLLEEAKGDGLSPQLRELSKAYQRP
jgi:hypothetical protein